MGVLVDVTVQSAGRSFTRSYVADPRHGPLPALLLMLTFSTGVVDAVSILGLGRVFVANMTGNIVFTAFALVGAPGFSLAAALSALAGFLVGAYVGGHLVTRFAEHRGRLLRNTVAVEFGLLLVGLLIAVAAGSPLPPGTRDLTAGLAAIALGMQNAAVRKLAVPDLTTTVLTMTLTGIGADVHEHKTGVAVRRALSVVAMFAGATVGALLVLHVDVSAALALATGLLAAVTVAATAASRSPAPWHAPGQV